MHSVTISLLLSFFESKVRTSGIRDVSSRMNTGDITGCFSASYMNNMLQ